MIIVASVFIGGWFNKLHLTLLFQPILLKENRHFGPVHTRCEFGPVHTSVKPNLNLPKGSRSASPSLSSVATTFKEMEEAMSVGKNNVH